VADTFRNGASLLARAFRFGFIDGLDLRAQCGQIKGMQGSWYPATTGNGADAVKAFLSRLATQMQTLSHLRWSVIRLDNPKLEIIEPQNNCGRS
jgi:hypothetical protein